MVLTEQTAVPTAALPIQEFKDHLRLGTGFADDGVQDVLAEGYLRAALAAIEGRIGKALLARDFLLALDGWRDSGAQAIPVAPVSAILSVTVRDATGVATVLAASTYRLRKDMHRPRLVGAGMSLPGVPADGTVEVQSVTVSAVNYRITVRAARQGAPSRPKPDQRFREGGRVFRITAVAEVGGAGHYLTCYATEEVLA